MGKVIAKAAVWFVIFTILITLGLEMISAYLSVRTKCLTAIKLERKHEK